MTPRSELGDLATDLAWSLWRELGVPGIVRRHEGWLVTPEPLILYTAALGDRDRRLRDNALAWCTAHLPLVSLRALRHSFNQEQWPVGEVASFSATVTTATGASWPAASEGRPFVTDAHYEGLGAPFGEPSQLTLRLRSLFGIGVRAEVLRALLTSGQPSRTLAELADAAMATKRQTTDAVEQLAWSAAVRVDRSRQPHRVRLERREPLEQLAGPLPNLAVHWGPLLRLVAGLVDWHEASRSLSDDLAAAQLHRALQDRADQLQRLGLDLPTAGTAFGAEGPRWAVDLVSGLAAGRPVGLAG